MQPNIREREEYNVGTYVLHKTYKTVVFTVTIIVQSIKLKLAVSYLIESSYKIIFCNVYYNNQ